MSSLFSILACLGERFAIKWILATFQFSFLREERSRIKTWLRKEIPSFHSRSLRRERFVLGFLTGLPAIISFLAPCHGERSIADALSWLSKVLFQFSLPAWGAILLISLIFFDIGISILAPCLGSDMTIYELNENVWVSILAPPALGAIRDTKKWQSASWIFQFSLPAWRAILWRVCNIDATENFNSRPLRESDLYAYPRHTSTRGILILVPVLGAIGLTNVTKAVLKFQFSLPPWGAILRN